MPIESDNPTIVPEQTYDLWFIKRIEIVAAPDGRISRRIHWFRGRDTGEKLTGEGGNPLLDHHGNEKTRLELLPASRAEANTADLEALAREQADQGDTSVRDMIDSLLGLEAKINKARGVID